MTLVPKIQIAPHGPFLSRIVQGYWRLAEWEMTSQECLSFVKEGIDMGITTVDHANVYGDPSCEVLFGKALQIDPSVRDQIEIISKCGITPASHGKIDHYNSSKGAIVTSVEQSLMRLGLAHLDVLLIHRPDFLMDVDEVASAFEQLKSAGKVNHLGVSNFNASQFTLLQSRIHSSLVTNQVEINPVNLQSLEDGTLDILQQAKISPMAWSCLAGGRVFDGSFETSQRIMACLMQLVDELSADSMDQIIYAWVMKIPSSPLPILGTGNIDRVKNAVKSLELSMTHEQWYRVLRASRGHDVA